MAMRKYSEKSLEALSSNKTLAKYRNRVIFGVQVSRFLAFQEDVGFPCSLISSDFSLFYADTDCIRAFMSLNYNQNRSWTDLCGYARIVFFIGDLCAICGLLFLFSSDSRLQMIQECFLCFIT